MKNDVRTRIRRYLAQDGLCHWCKQPMVLIVGYNPRGWKPPENMATLEHIHSRLSPHRGPHGGYANVAACSKCNHARGAAEVAALSKEEQRARAGRKPCPMHSDNWDGATRFVCTCDRGSGG